PYSARRWHEVENQEIRKRGVATVFTGREVWYHGRAGFYDISRIALRKQMLYGLTIYQVGPEFRPVRIIEAPYATWDGSRWHLSMPRTQWFGHGGVRETKGVPKDFVLPETLADFSEIAVEPEEFSYAMLRRQIRSLRSKGVDASESWVDLHL